jgi:hypothetical protein
VLHGVDATACSSVKSVRGWVKEHGLLDFVVFNFPHVGLGKLVISLPLCKYNIC